MNNAAITIRPLTIADWSAVDRIYVEGMATRMATFQTEPIPFEEWDATHRPDCRLVAVIDGQVFGWFALMPTSRRAVYAGVCDESIYIAESARGQGIGTKLLRAGIAASEQAGIWTLQAGIFTDNVPSIKLHEKCGFRTVGFRERIGQLDGIWRDTLIMERRSRITGI